MPRVAKSPRVTTPAKISRDAEATQAEILAAAEEEFAKHGLLGARTEQISAQTGVAKSMIYYYFKSKEGLYQAVLERCATQLVKISQQLDIEALPPEQALEQFLRAFLDLVAQKPHLPLLMLHESIQNQGQYYKRTGSLAIDSVLVNILERGVAMKVFRPLDPLQAAINILGTCLFYFMGYGNLRHLGSGQRLLSKALIEEHVEETIAFTLAGVRRQPQ